MANKENKVRTGKNTLGACGILKSYNLTYKKARDIEGDNVDFNGADKGDKITGKFTLLVGEFETITINLGYGVSQYKSYKDKDTEEVKVIDNKNFALLSDMEAGKLPTVADVENKEDATYIQLSGKGNYKGRITENIYKNNNTEQVVTSTQYELGYGNLYAKDKDKVKELYAQFTLDVFVRNVSEETKYNPKTEEEEETGRVEMKVYVPTSKGSVIPLTLIAEEDMADAIRENVDEEGGESLYIEGTIHCSTTEIEEDSAKGNGWGRKRKETKKVYKNELIIDYAEPIEDEEDEEGNIIEKAFNPDDIKAYVVERENIIENIKNEEAEEESKSEKRGFGKKADKTDENEEPKKETRKRRW